MFNGEILIIIPKLSVLSLSIWSSAYLDIWDHSKKGKGPFYSQINMVYTEISMQIMPEIKAENPKRNNHAGAARNIRLGVCLIQNKAEEI